MSTSALTLLPQHSGHNLAELSPLLRIGEGDKNPSSSLADAIKERFGHFKAHEEATWKEMISAGEEVALFMQGKQFLTQNPYKQGGWLPYTPPTNANAAVKRALSVMQYHTSGNLEKWLNSNPDIRITAGVESDDARESAEGADIILAHYEPKFYTARATTAEGMEGMTFGSYIWRIRVDPALKSVTAYRQIFENREVKIGPGWGKCGDCSYEGNAVDFNPGPDGTFICPKCHEEALVIPPASDVIPSMSGEEPVELGDFRLDLIPFSQCRWDLRFHADESPWMIIRRRTTMSAVRQVLGNIKLPGQGDSSDFGLDTVDRLAYSGQATAGHSSNGERKSLYKEPATVEEFWMSADEYGDIQLQNSTETVSGEELPSGVRLGDLLKGKSICVLGLNEMSTVLGIFVEDHRDYIAQGKWYAKSGTGAGRGLQDLVEVQKNFNSDHQLIHTHLRSGAAPAMLVAGEVLGEEGKSRYIGTPGMNIPVPLSALAEGVSLDQLVRPAFQPTSTSGQLFEFTYNRLSEFAQFASHFLPFTSGMPGVDNKTATGANITQAATNALYTPVLSIKGEIRKLVAEKLIRLYPKYFPIDRYFPLGGKHGRQSGRYLSGADLNTDLLYEVVQDSWLPRNSYQKQTAYTGFVGLFGGVLGWMQARQADPTRVADMERAFDLELESETRNVAESLCFKRVRQMQQALNLVDDPMMLVGVSQDETGQMVPTGQGAIQPPVSQYEPAHEIKRQWLMEWLDSDESQEAPMPLRLAVEQLIMLHTSYAGQQQALLAAQAGAVQTAGAAPAALAQQAMQPADNTEEQEVLRLQEEAARAEDEAAEREADRAQTAELKRAELETKERVATAQKGVRR